MVLMFGICLPVDTLIFYAEPFGVFGTLGTTILAFAPFLSMVADSTYPVKKIWVKGKCKFYCYNTIDILLCFILKMFFLAGKIYQVLKNSWTEHLSITFNEKYEFGM